MRPAVVACPGPDWRHTRAAQVRAGKGTCGGCGRPLTGRLTWFCRAPAWCRTAYLANHDWGFAREIALKRSSPSGYKRDAACVRCSATTGSTTRPSDIGRPLEVNHMDPRNGEGYQLGCHHHQDRLEVLCHSDHLIVTREQRAARRV